MSVPAFTIDGVLPPYVGADGPGGAPSDMTPYRATTIEVVDRFATSVIRREILRGWLQHRAEMRAHGIAEGFQWLDGSFVEDKTPQDVDVVTYFKRPVAHATSAAIGELFFANPDVFRKAIVKQRLKVDAMFVDMDATAESIVEGTRYYCGLFSHRRGDGIWKGMIRVALDDALDGHALAKLDQGDAILDQVEDGHQEVEIAVQEEPL